MKKFRAVSHAANFRSHVHCTTTCSNITQWSSTYEILRRFEHIQWLLLRLEIEELDEMSISTQELKTFQQIFERLSHFDSVTKELQKGANNFTEEQILFDVVMEEFPDTSSRLSRNSEFVQYYDFEVAIVKIQEWIVRDLMNCNFRLLRSWKSTWINLMEIKTINTFLYWSVHWKGGD